MHVSSSTTALAAASFYSQNPAIAACSALTGQYPAHRFRLASHRYAIRADGRNKARGLPVGGCRWVGPKDPVTDRQPYGHGAVADALEHSPPETTHRFEHQ